MAANDKKWIEILKSTQVKDLLRARHKKLLTVDHSQRLGDVMKVCLTPSCGPCR